MTEVHVPQVMTKAADMHGCTVEVAWRDPPYLPTVNNLDMVSIVEEAARGLFGEDRWQRLAAPTMAAEDFGFMARASCSLLPRQSATAAALSTLHIYIEAMSACMWPIVRQKPMFLLASTVPLPDIVLPGCSLLAN